MKKIETAIPGVYMIEPRLFKDTRGYFFESYNKNVYDREVAPISFVQDNESFSTRGVVRGLHFQRPPYSQAKLVRVIKGVVLDVAVDIRKGSPTYGKYVKAVLSDENKLQFFIPKGFAHGFAVLSDEALFQYKCDAFYEPSAEGGIRWNDPDLNIDWGIPADQIILSAKDELHPLLKDFDSPFTFEKEPE
ncbi:MAG: dTDP-4-dehydrorhamnose 3,5-epimerase [Phocaeicola sp.]|nr:dTDP-4-dehydrorhamnose 3,5-epimerase [Phocaeicola sp.]